MRGYLQGRAENTTCDPYHSSTNAIRMRLKSPSGNEAPSSSPAGVLVDCGVLFRDRGRRRVPEQELSHAATSTPTTYRCQQCIIFTVIILFIIAMSIVRWRQSHVSVRVVQQHCSTLDCLRWQFPLFIRWARSILIGCSISEVCNNIIINLENRTSQ